MWMCKVFIIWPLPLGNNVKYPFQKLKMVHVYFVHVVLVKLKMYF